MTEKLETDVDAQDLARAFINREEIEIRPGLTLVRSETLGKYFVRETMDRLEDLPPSMLREIGDFLLSKK